MKNLETDSSQQEVSRRVYPVDVKLAAVRAVIDDGAPYQAAADEFGISSVSTLKKWLILYRREGAESLYPKPIGRPKGVHTPIGIRFSRFDEALLRMENEKLLRKLGG